MPNTVAKVLNILFFVGFVATDLLISHVAAVRVAGVACFVCGVVWMWKRSIEVGIEGREPSFFLTGVPALLAGLLMVALGLATLLQSGRVACAVS